MGLMDKFAAVEIKTDRRISEADRVFCERQQEAYDSAGRYLWELRGTLQKEIENQARIFKGSQYTSYLSAGGLPLSVNGIENTISERNALFIRTVVRYFTNTYQVTLHDDVIRWHLIPGCKEIDGYMKRGMYRARDEAQKTSRDAVLHLKLRYEEIIDEIFMQLGGFSFKEKAIVEVKNKAYKSAHIQPGDLENFTLKNKTITFDENAELCTYNPLTRVLDNWKVSGNLHNILAALACYESGETNKGEDVFGDLYTQNDVGIGNRETLNKAKVESIRLYKTNRVDVKFTDDNAAREFADEYLRTKINYINTAVDEILG